jgi:hypothetical protein
MRSVPPRGRDCVKTTDRTLSINCSTRGGKKEDGEVSLAGRMAGHEKGGKER